MGWRGTGVREVSQIDWRRAKMMNIELYIEEVQDSRQYQGAIAD